MIVREDIQEDEEQLDQLVCGKARHSGVSIALALP